MSDELSELLEAESQKTHTEYSWEMSWGTRGASCSTSPYGVKMPLWIAILDANDAIDNLMDEDDYDEDYSGTPDIQIERYIDGKYDDRIDFDHLGCFSEVVAWADDNWVRAEWDAYIQATKDMTNKLRKEAGLEV